MTQAIGKVEILGTTWPASWFRIKTQLEQMADHFIGRGDYRTLCRQEKLHDEASQETLVKFLHDLGVIVHFADFELEDMHVLEPRWLTGAVYRIVNSDELADDKGVLKLQSLRNILKPADDDGFDFPPQRHPFIVNLMKKFELCYSIDKRTLLIPDLLEVPEPEIDFNFDDSLKFRIDYDFLPRSIIPRFIVRKSGSIVGRLRWRTGVVLKDPAFQSGAVIKADETARRIYIYVSGDQQRDYLTVIRSAFLDINRSFEKLGYVEKVPLPDNPEVTVSYAHLVRLEKASIAEHFPDGAERSYNVKELLGTLYVEQPPTEEELIRILKGIVTELDSERTLMQKAKEIVQFRKLGLAARGRSGGFQAVSAGPQMRGGESSRNGLLARRVHSRSRSVRRAKKGHLRASQSQSKAFFASASPRGVPAPSSFLSSSDKLNAPP